MAYCDIFPRNLNSVQSYAFYALFIYLFIHLFIYLFIYVLIDLLIDLLALLTDWCVCLLVDLLIIY